MTENQWNRANRAFQANLVGPKKDGNKFAFLVDIPKQLRYMYDMNKIPSVIAGDPPQDYEDLGRSYGILLRERDELGLKVKDVTEAFNSLHGERNALSKQNQACRVENLRLRAEKRELIAASEDLLTECRSALRLLSTKITIDDKDFSLLRTCFVKGRQQLRVKLLAVIAKAEGRE